MSPQWKDALVKPFTATAEVLRFPRDEQRDAERRFHAYFTRSRREILKIQRLRYRIFSQEYGATFHAPLGLDRDRFDRHCLHLVVKDNESGELVGYTRVLPSEKLNKTGGFYSQQEFDMRALEGLSGRVAEIGRTCIHPDFRSGAVITTLWARLAQYMVENDVRYLLGCASVSLAEDYCVEAINRRIRERHMAPAAYRVAPRQHYVGFARDSFPREQLRMPPLLKAYLRMGAQVCGEPCWDPEFNCLDYFILMPVENLPARYVQHFMQTAQAV
jgi:putative hemolysin